MAPPTFCTPVESEFALTKAGWHKFGVLYHNITALCMSPPLLSVSVTVSPCLLLLSCPFLYPIAEGKNAEYYSRPGLIIRAPPLGAWAECDAVAALVSYLVSAPLDGDEVANFDDGLIGELH